MKMDTIMIRALGAAVLGTVLVGGCASTQSGLDTATAGVADTRSQLMEGKEDVGEVLAALSAFRMQPNAETGEVQVPADLKKAFERYRSALQKLEKAVEQARARRVAMESRIQEHIVKWQAEIEHISSEQARQISAERMARLEEVLLELGDALEGLGDKYEPFISNLKDVELVLANDLSRGGVRAIQPIILDVSGQAAEIEQAIAAVDEKMAATIAEFER